MVPPSLDMHDITTMDLGYKYNLKFTKASFGSRWKQVLGFGIALLFLTYDL